MLHEARVVALDKTGTLTEGRPELTDLILADGFDEDEVLGLVAAVEAQSEHPIAEAITRAAASKGLTGAAVEAFTSVTGYGVEAKVEGKHILVGADRFMTREGIDLGALEGSGDSLGLKGGRTPPCTLPSTVR